MEFILDSVGWVEVTLDRYIDFFIFKDFLVQNRKVSIFEYSIQKNSKSNIGSVQNLYDRRID